MHNGAGQGNDQGKSGQNSDHLHLNAGHKVYYIFYRYPSDWVKSNTLNACLVCRQQYVLLPLRCNKINIKMVGISSPFLSFRLTVFWIIQKAKFILTSFVFMKWWLCMVRRLLCTLY